MPMINFMNYSLSTAAEGFVPSHAPLKNNKQLNIPFQSPQPKRGTNKSELQGLTPSSRVCACGMRRGGWGHASILSVIPNMAPNSLRLKHFVVVEDHNSIHSSQESRTKWWGTLQCGHHRETVTWQLILPFSVPHPHPRHHVRPPKLRCSIMALRKSTPPSRREP